MTNSLLIKRYTWMLWLSSIALFLLISGCSENVKAKLILPQDCKEGELYQFRSEIISGDTGGLAYEWIFSDGISFYTQNCERSFPDNGTYTLTFKITTPNERKIVESHNIVVKNVPPTISGCKIDNAFYKDPVPCSVTIEDPGKDNLIVEWDFGDGSGTIKKGPFNPGDSVSENHEFTAIGDHTIRVTVRDDDGGKDELTSTVVVKKYILPYSREELGSWFQDMADDILNCYHQTGNYNRLNISDIKLDEQTASADGIIIWEGKLLGKYQTEIHLEIKIDRDQIEVRAQIVNDTAKIPADSTCHFQNWAVDKYATAKLRDRYSQK